jgi:hypothetical protein
MRSAYLTFGLTGKLCGGCGDEIEQANAAHHLPQVAHKHGAFLRIYCWSIKRRIGKRTLQDLRSLKPELNTDLFPAVLHRPHHPSKTEVN